MKFTGISQGLQTILEHDDYPSLLRHRACSTLRCSKAWKRQESMWLYATLTDGSEEKTWMGTFNLPLTLPICTIIVISAILAEQEAVFSLYSDHI